VVGVSRTIQANGHQSMAVTGHNRKGRSMSIFKRKPQKLQIEVFADAVREIIGDEPFNVEIQSWHVTNTYEKFSIWLPDRRYHINDNPNHNGMEACLLMLKHKTEEMSRA